jgi:hypothetical protein
VLLTKVVANGVLVPFADQTAWLRICPPPKFDPLIVRVRSGLPTTALVGEIVKELN